MGTFKVPIEVGDLTGQQWVHVEALADTGATLTVIPEQLWQSLGLNPSGTRTFELADGSQLELPVADALVRIEGEQHSNPVVAGPGAGDSILGAVTRGSFFLAPDPARKRLIPVRGLLL